MQRPGEKINHALVLGGEQGIGKDAVLEPLKLAVGAWNFHEISPQEALGSFNEFVQSVVLRISEGKDLGDIDRFAFYEATKTLIAAPPDTLRVNPKFVKPYYVLNIVGGDHHHQPQGRRHLSAARRPPPLRRLDDRRAERLRRGHWTRYWARLERGRRGGGRRLSQGARPQPLQPQSPAPHTQAFYEMVNAMRSEKESEMDDIIENLGQARCADHQQHHRQSQQPQSP